MADPQPPNPSVTGALASIGNGLIRVLPPAFLLLVVLNLVFIAALGWVFDHNAAQRNALLTKIVEHCLLPPPQSRLGGEVAPLFK